MCEALSGTCCRSVPERRESCALTDPWEGEGLPGQTLEQLRSVTERRCQEDLWGLPCILLLWPPH